LEGPPKKSTLGGAPPFFSGGTFGCYFFPRFFWVNQGFFLCLIVRVFRDPHSSVRGPVPRPFSRAPSSSDEAGPATLFLFSASRAALLPLSVVCFVPLLISLPTRFSDVETLCGQSGSTVETRSAHPPARPYVTAVGPPGEDLVPPSPDVPDTPLNFFFTRTGPSSQKPVSYACRVFQGPPPCLLPPSFRGVSLSPPSHAMGIWFLPSCRIW